MTKLTLPSVSVHQKNLQKLRQVQGRVKPRLIGSHQTTVKDQHALEAGSLSASLVNTIKIKNAQFEDREKDKMKVVKSQLTKK